jgi:hypothetical protein
MEPKISEHNERRIKFRFAIERELRYKVVEDGTMISSGTGQTINVGSGGVAFSAEQQLKPGAFVEVSISWPALLDETCMMRLIVFGRVLRSAGRETVCSVDKYEFRTQARSVQPDAPPRSDKMLQRWADGIRKEALKASQTPAYERSAGIRGFPDSDAARIARAEC